MWPQYDGFFFILLLTELPIYSFWYSYLGCQDHTNITYHLDGHICIKFGFVGPLFIKKMVDNTMELLPRTGGIEISGHKFHGVVDHVL